MLVIKADLDNKGMEPREGLWLRMTDLGRVAVPARTFARSVIFLEAQGYCYNQSPKMI